MTEFEKKLIEQNEKILKNQETIIEMLFLSPSLASDNNETIYAFLEPYYKHHNMPLEPLRQLLKEKEEPREKQQCEPEVQSDYQPLGEEPYRVLVLVSFASFED